MRIVCDTNALISGLLWRGKPARVLQRIDRDEDQLFLSHDLLGEVADVMNRPKFRTVLDRAGRTAHELVRWILHRGIMVLPKPLHRVVVSADPTDDCVLACAATVRADYIVSGDRHLLELGSFEEIPIVTPERYLRLVTSSGPP